MNRVIRDTKRKSLKELPSGERKRALRKVYRSRRSKITEKARNAKSAAIWRRLSVNAAYRNAGTVMFYVNCDYEVMTDNMIEAALKAGKRVVVPLVNNADERAMSAVAVTDMQNDLCVGTFGVREPRKRKAVKPDSIDLVIVPAIAFDLRGHRLGYGKGYYDTWLQRFPIEKRIGLAYELQVVESLPYDVNDQPVGVIVTEMRTLKTKSFYRR